MGGMMGGAMGAWILLWIILGLAVVTVGGVVVSQVLNTRRKADQPRIQVAESLAAQEAKDALRLRYARGEISREEYLQGKVELED